MQSLFVIPNLVRNPVLKQILKQVQDDKKRGTPPFARTVLAMTKAATAYRDYPTNLLQKLTIVTKCNSYVRENVRKVGCRKEEVSSRK